MRVGLGEDGFKVLSDSGHRNAEGGSDAIDTPTFGEQTEDSGFLLRQAEGICLTTNRCAVLRRFENSNDPFFAAWKPNQSGIGSGRGEFKKAPGTPTNVDLAG